MMRAMRAMTQRLGRRPHWWMVKIDATEVGHEVLMAPFLRIESRTPVRAIQEYSATLAMLWIV